MSVGNLSNASVQSTGETNNARLAQVSSSELLTFSMAKPSWLSSGETSSLDNTFVIAMLRTLCM